MESEVGHLHALLEVDSSFPIDLHFVYLDVTSSVASL